MDTVHQVLGVSGAITDPKYWGERLTKALLFCSWGISASTGEEGIHSDL